MNVGQVRSSAATRLRVVWNRENVEERNRLPASTLIKELLMGAPAADVAKQNHIISIRSPGKGAWKNFDAGLRR
jgi:hypothetical protein